MDTLVYLNVFFFLSEELSLVAGSCSIAPGRGMVVSPFSAE